MPKCKVEVPGEGPRRAAVMLIGEAPGKEEVIAKKPFVGRAGRFLMKTLSKFGIDRKKIYITNVVKFRPTRTINGKVKDRAPKSQEIKACLPLLRKEIKLIKPKVICLLGKTAQRALAELDLPKIETYHPAAAMRDKKKRAFFEKELKKITKFI
ncbi:MAG: uracil-DNA glycosylase [Candidatus Woesearchaeota archaeon]